MLNTKYSKIIKKYFEVLQFFKPKEKNIYWCLTFNFLLNLMWIVQTPFELFSSQWKPPSRVVKTPTLKNSHFRKMPYAWNQIRTTFSGPSVSKILINWKSRTQGYDIGPFLHNPWNVWASNLCFSVKFEDIQIMINSSAHEFLTI